MDLVLDDHQFRLAIYLASPGLYRMLEAKDFSMAALSPKELLTLKKYYNRMSFRPTPFGLFSSYSLVRWSDRGPVELDPPCKAALSLLPDQQVATAVSQILAAAGIADEYELNPTLYRLGSEFRFIKTMPDKESSRLLFSLECIEINPLTRALSLLLASGAKPGSEILGFLIKKTGCSGADAESYISFLKEAQVIRGRSALNIVGQDYLSRLAASGRLPSRLQQFISEFHDLSRQGTGVSAARLAALERELKAALAEHGAPPPEKLFYAAAGRTGAGGGLPQAYRGQLARALAALTKLAPRVPAGNLEQFAAEFTARFEGRKIPLMAALDPDAGISYGDYTEPAAMPAMFKDIPVRKKQPAGKEIAWSQAHRLLLEKWNSKAGQQGTIKLWATDLESLEAPADLPLPPSMGVMFRPTSEGLLLESAAGVSGVSLIGRFSAFSGEVYELARRIARREAQSNPDVAFAEIGQLSDSYTDNINRRLAI